MRYRTYVPGPPLADFVDTLWLYEGYRQAHTRERLLPDGSMELVFNLSEDEIRIFDSTDDTRPHRSPGSVVIGAQTEFFVIDTAEERSVMGAHFKPGGAFPFFPLPSGELRSQSVPLETLWGRAAADVRDQLLEASTPEAKFRVLECALLRQPGRRWDRHPAVGFALRALAGMPPAQTIADLSDRIGLSQKRFIQVFGDAVGLTPKLFCRIQRFQQVVRMVGQGQRVDWADVAVSCGYFDQAHFIHDFRAFSGLTPSDYLTLRTAHLNHVPVLD